jgi:Domain of unknown function (DUF4203)
MIIARLLAGVCVLLLGRRLFWLFVGAVGFVLGMDVAALLFRGMPHSEVLLIALVGGMVGALLALALEELMIGIAGFAAGAYVAAQILITVMPYPGRNIWIVMLIGGIAGTWLFVGLFDWALIALSSVIGAGFIIQALPATTQVSYIAFSALVVAGVMVQARLMDREKLPPRFT